MISSHPDAPGRRLSVTLKYSSDQSKDEGDKLFKEASKKRLAFQGCRIFRLCSREKTDEDRAESIRKYLAAAHHYMNCGDWEKAGEAYENCARLQEMGTELEGIDAAANYANAALCYKQDKLIKERGGATATNRGNRSVSVVMDRVRLPSIDENKLKPIDSSLSRLAHMQMDYKNYGKARSNFEKMGKSLCSDEETVANADDFFFKAAMCALADNPEGAKEVVEEYFKVRPSLQQKERFVFWAKLQKVLEEKDEAQFEAIVNENNNAKVWIQKILADLAAQRNYKEISVAIDERRRRQSIKGLRNDPFYTLYN